MDKKTCFVLLYFCYIVTSGPTDPTKLSSNCNCQRTLFAVNLRLLDVSNRVITPLILPGTALINGTF